MPGLLAIPTRLAVHARYYSRGPPRNGGGRRVWHAEHTTRLARWRELPAAPHDPRPEHAGPGQRPKRGRVPQAVPPQNDVQARDTGNMASNPTLVQGAYWEQRRSSAQRRYLRACETLAHLRKLAQSTPLQVNSGAQPVNVVGGVPVPAVETLIEGGTIGAQPGGRLAQQGRRSRRRELDNAPSAQNRQRACAPGRGCSIRRAPAELARATRQAGGPPQEPPACR